MGNGQEAKGRGSALRNIIIISGNFVQDFLLRIIHNLTGNIGNH
jgi:hypothetical protein